MKFSKGALRSRGLKNGHRTLMEPSRVVVDERHDGPARTYSTEGYVKSNNGIAIPDEFRKQIEAAMPKPEPAPKARPVREAKPIIVVRTVKRAYTPPAHVPSPSPAVPMTFLSSSRGFF